MCDTSKCYATQSFSSLQFILILIFETFLWQIRRTTHVVPTRTQYVLYLSWSFCVGRQSPHDTLMLTQLNDECVHNNWLWSSSAFRFHLDQMTWSRYRFASREWILFHAIKLRVSCNRIWVMDVDACLCLIECEYTRKQKNVFPHKNYIIFEWNNNNNNNINYHHHRWAYAARNHGTQHIRLDGKCEVHATEIHHHHHHHLLSIFEGNFHGNSSRKRKQMNSNNNLFIGVYNNSNDDIWWFKWRPW